MRRANKRKKLSEMEERKLVSIWTIKWQIEEERLSKTKRRTMRGTNKSKKMSEVEERNLVSRWRRRCEQCKRGHKSWWEAWRRTRMMSRTKKKKMREMDEKKIKNKMRSGRRDCRRWRESRRTTGTERWVRWGEEACNEIKNKMRKWDRRLRQMKRNEKEDRKRRWVRWWAEGKLVFRVNGRDIRKTWTSTSLDARWHTYTHTWGYNER